MWLKPGISLPGKPEMNGDGVKVAALNVNGGGDATELRDVIKVPVKDLTFEEMQQLRVIMKRHKYRYQIKIIPKIISSGIGYFIIIFYDLFIEAGLFKQYFSVFKTL